ncbi:hypothetical protein O3P69_010037 [Scylla paramamosain]|uniref:Uncharacterized protein n=1 Tax=Scylla paramamosain TaxID=85552 RepID=A0AAW0SPY2_SCYPA
MPDDIVLILADYEFTRPVVTQRSVRTTSTRPDGTTLELPANTHDIWCSEDRRCRPPSMAMNSDSSMSTINTQDAVSSSIQGAEISVLPASNKDTRCGKRCLLMTAANGSNIKTFGTHTIHLILNSHRFKWTFTIADVSRPLLGADFLHAHSLFIDMKESLIVDSTTFESTNLRHALLPAVHLNSVFCSNVYAKILMDYLDIVRPQFHLVVPKHGVMYHTTTTGPTLHARAKQVSSQRAKEEFIIMKEMGIMCRSDTPWGIPAAHGSKIDWRLEALWGLALSE